MACGPQLRFLWVDRQGQVLSFQRDRIPGLNSKVLLLYGRELWTISLNGECCGAQRHESKKPTNWSDMSDTWADWLSWGPPSTHSPSPWKEIVCHWSSWRTCGIMFLFSGRRFELQSRFFHGELAENKKFTSNIRQFQRRCVQEMFTKRLNLSQRQFFVFSF